MRKIGLMNNTAGDAIVEAAILFPVMIMLLAGAVLLSLYLPTRASLQRATQYAATAAATEISDTWLFFDVGEMDYAWEKRSANLENVYAALISGNRRSAEKTEIIAETIENRGISSKAGKLTVGYRLVNRVVYQEIVVTAMREYTLPVNLTFVGLPRTIPIVVTSTAVVQNGDEFVRNMDLAADFLKFLTDKLGLKDAVGNIGDYWGKGMSALGLR